MTDKNLRGESMQDSNTDNEMRIPIKASMTKVVERSKAGEIIQGNADLNIDSMQDYVAYGSLEIAVGDCVRDGVMPSKEQMAILEKRHEQRIKLSRKQRSTTNNVER